MWEKIAYAETIKASHPINGVTILFLDAAIKLVFI